MRIINKIPKNYILIHGAWRGSWSFNKVAIRMREQGFKVQTPDLPGHGKNMRKNMHDFKDVTLSKYVDHIEELVKASKEPVVLVGHSMAGVVISQVAENMYEKIDKLVYISGFIPKNEGSLLDEEQKAKIPSVALAVSINEPECFISLSEPSKIRELFYNCCTQEDVNYALLNIQKQPLRPFVDKILITNERFGIVPKLYIECLQDNAIHIEDQRRMQSYVTCDVKSLDTDHSPFFAMEKELVEILESV